MKFLMLIVFAMFLTNCATLSNMSCDQYCGNQNSICERDGYAEYREYWATQKASVGCFGKEACAENKAKKKRYWEAIEFGIKNRYSMYQCRAPGEYEQRKVERYRKSAQEYAEQLDTEYKYINEFVRYLYKYGLYH
jgi:hypothetical protein